MSSGALMDLTIVIKGAGEMASAVAWRLYMAGLRRIVALEIPYPLAVRREVSFCEAVHDGEKTVEGVGAVRVDDPAKIQQAWQAGKIVVIVDPQWHSLKRIQPNVVIDATLAKRNLGTRMEEAPLVIALGPGFVAQKDAHMVIETNRGHNLGRILTSGSAEPNTGVPGSVGGYAAERVLRSPGEGLFSSARRIGDLIKRNEVVGHVNGAEVTAGIDGVIRGLIRSGIEVSGGLKIGDIDPRSDVSYCHTISDKARAIAGSVLEAILRVYNRP